MTQWGLWGLSPTGVDYGTVRALRASVTTCTDNDTVRALRTISWGVAMHEASWVLGISRVSWEAGTPDIYPRVGASGRDLCAGEYPAAAGEGLQRPEARQGELLVPQLGRYTRGSPAVQGGPSKESGFLRGHPALPPFLPLPLGRVHQGATSSQGRGWVDVRHRGILPCLPHSLFPWAGYTAGSSSRRGEPRTGHPPHACQESGAPPPVWWATPPVPPASSYRFPWEGCSQGAPSGRGGAPRGGGAWSLL